MAGEMIQLLLTQSPNNNTYAPDTDVEGQVSINIEGPSQVDYKRVIVSLIGKAEVYFTISPNSRTNERHYQELDTFLKKDLIIWDKDETARSDSHSGSITNLSAGGRYVFPFSFPLKPDLTSNRSTSLPSSLDSRDGKIKYTLEAKLIRLGHNETEIEAAATFTRINVRTSVDINRSDLLAPRSAQKECTSGFFCVGRGPVTVTTTIPRSGYCIVIDEIPIQVVVEPGPGQQLQWVSASLMQRITCTSHGQPSLLQQVVTKITNTQMPRKGISFTWNVPSLQVPDTLELTLTNCNLIRLGYFIRIEYTAQCTDVQCIDIPIVIGNVPLVNENSGGLSAASSIQVSGQPGRPGGGGGGGGGGGYQPTLSLSNASVGYHPPPIPVQENRVTSREEEGGNKHGENLPLLKE